MKNKKMKTPSEILAEKNARANRIRKEIGGIVGSPYRENEIIEGKTPMKNSLKQQQKYAIATMLATNTKEGTLARLQRNREYYSNDEYAAILEFVEKIDKYYKKRDGFVPKTVIKIVNG